MIRLIAVLAPLTAVLALALTLAGQVHEDMFNPTAVLDTTQVSVRGYATHLCRSDCGVDD